MRNRATTCLRNLPFLIVILLSILMTPANLIAQANVQDEKLDTMKNMVGNQYRATQNLVITIRSADTKWPGNPLTKGRRFLVTGLTDEGFFEIQTADKCSRGSSGYQSSGYDHSLYWVHGGEFLDKIGKGVILEKAGSEGERNRLLADPSYWSSAWREMVERIRPGD